MFTPSHNGGRQPIAELQVEVPPKRTPSYYLDGNRARQIVLDN